MGGVVLDINSKSSHADVMCIIRRRISAKACYCRISSVKPCAMEGHDACAWAGVCALVCTLRRAPVSEEQCRSLIRDVAALLNALAKECCKNGALNDITLGQVMNDLARKRLQGELALVCSHMSFLDNPIASAGNVDVVRPIKEEAMTALNDAMRILKEVGEQVNDELFADQVNCLRCMIWGKQSVSVVKLMILKAQSRADCMITEERAKLVSAARASRHALQGYVRNPSRLHPQSPPLAGFHLNFLEPRFADKSIIGNTLQDIDHVIKDIESKWRDDIMQLQAVTASWCPAWEQKAEELVSDVGARTALLTNVAYLKLGHAAGLLSLMHQQLAKLQSDTFGFVLSPAQSTSVAATVKLARATVVVTYSLFKLCHSLPRLAVKHDQVNEAKAFQQQLVLNGATLPASMQRVLDCFTAGEGGAVDPPIPEI